MEHLTVTVTIADDTAIIGRSELTVAVNATWAQGEEDWLKDKYLSVAHFVVTDAWHNIRHSP